MAVKLLAVIMGGGVGALLRFGVSNYSAKLFGSTFPWGTLLVNMIGCLFIGFLFSVIDPRIHHPAIALFFITGFLGALTTFSTFALDGILAFQNGSTHVLIINLVLNNLGGLLLVLLGMWLGKQIIPG